MQQESLAIALRLLLRRFGPVSEALEERIWRLSREQGENLVEALLDFQGMAEVEEWLARYE